MAAFAVSGAGAQQPSGKVLVAYFSHSGNTREVARQPKDKQKEHKKDLEV